MISVESVNQAFPLYPITVEDKGWVYGVWYCGTAWAKVKLHGQYPPTFLQRSLALFPMAKAILHCPSGIIVGSGVTVDRMVCSVRKPMIQADAAALPFKSASFDLILCDPPYTRKDATIYGCAPYPMGKFMRESLRILKPTGYLGILHTAYPSYRRKEWKLVALIAVVTGFCRATRIFSVFQKITPPS